MHTGYSREINNKKSKKNMNKNKRRVRDSNPRILIDRLVSSEVL